MKEHVHIWGRDPELISWLNMYHFELWGFSYHPSRMSEELILFTPKKECGVYYNSFVPVIECSIQKNEHLIELTFSFSIQKSVRIVTAILSVMAILFEALMLYWHFAMEHMGIAVVGPLLFLFFIYISLLISIHISKIRFTKTTVNTLRETGIHVDILCEARKP